MRLREPLNSRILKQRLADVYQQFFSKSSLVVSAPHFFTLAGEYIGYFGGVMVLQKLPLRIYVGLEELSQDKGIVLGDDALSFSLKKYIID